MAELKKTRLSPPSMPKALGAYSHGLAVDLIGPARMVFITGQLPLDTEGNLVSEDVEIQTRHIFENIKSILAEAGGDMSHVVKVQTFLTDVADFAKVSPVRNEYFEECRPASTLVGGVTLVKPGCRIEVEAIAVIPL